MARRRKKNTWAGIVVGPLVVCAALSALWKNETRFDYYRAAKKTTEVSALSEANAQQNISYTAQMDKDLTIEGDYIKSFSGYLVVQRSAEIYCWDKDEDSDGHTSWKLKWQSRVESNSRNRDIVQQLDSGRMIPDTYHLDDLAIASDQIEFVDSFAVIEPKGEKADSAIAQKLRREGNLLMLRKNNPSKLGDERIAYRGFLVPDTATWFGKYANGIGTADTSQKRTGLINLMIQDSGVLHHLVAGDRDTALQTTKQYLSRVKMIVRGAGTFVTFLGFLFFFGTIARFLYRVPVIGWVAEKGAFILSVLIAVPLALITIVCGYLFGHLFILFGLLALIGGLGLVAFRARKQTQETSRQFQQVLEKEHGRKLNFDDLKEMEFAELAHLALGDSEASSDELAFLYKWGKQHGWSSEKVEELLAEVKKVQLIPDSDRTSDDHLNQLIKLALADGELSPFEMRTIRVAAKKAGFDQKTVADLMTHVQQSAS